MWHSQILIASNIYHIGYATSPDGIHWTKVPGNGPDGAVLDYGAAGEFDEYTTAWPAVLATPDGFEMWYYGNSSTGGRLGYAISSDGKNWQKISGGGDQGACFNDAHAVSVIRMDNMYKMWYAVFDEDIVNYATSQVNTSVEKIISPLPDQFELYPNSPNPFNPSTRISYRLPLDSFVELRVFDIKGRCVKTLMNEFQDAGFHSVSFYADDLESGVYLCQLQVLDRTKTIRMQIIK